MKIDRIDQRQAAAYHEAGHAVVGYCCGYRISHEGIEIDDRQHTELRRHGVRLDVDVQGDPLLEQLQREAERNEVCVNCAGWLAEYRWHGQGGLHTDEDLQVYINVIRRENWAIVGARGDDSDTLTLLIERYPDATDGELIATFRKYQALAQDLLADPAAWHAVELLATALIAHGKLTCRDAETILGDIGFLTPGTAPRIPADQFVPC